MGSNYLMTRIRPLVVFDPSDKKHRKLFAQYIRSGRWDHSPVQLVANEPTQIDLGTMARQLIHFYTDKEFPVVKKQQKKRLT